MGFSIFTVKEFCSFGFDLIFSELFCVYMFLSLFSGTVSSESHIASNKIRQNYSE
jgi:hypothetical protein